MDSPFNSRYFFSMRMALAMILAGLSCGALHAEDWTVNGKDYHNVVVGQVEADLVHISYDGGIGTVALADLPPDLQKRFNYNPAGAKAGADTPASPGAEAQPEAANILPVKIGGTEIKLSCPPGMVDMPKDDPTVKAIGDLMPPDCLLLRSCVSSDALDIAKTPDPSKDIMTSHTFALKEALMDIDSGNFIDFVQRVAIKVSHGVLLSQNSPFDYVETEKRLDEFQKDTGVVIQQDSDIYSLGMVSRSDACVAFMSAEYVNMTFEGKTQRERCISVVAYVHLNKKVVIAVTSLTKPAILHEDMRTLKHTAEKYQIELQTLNNS